VRVDDVRADRPDRSRETEDAQRVDPGANRERPRLEAAFDELRA
jgi:hypothetical protein